MRKPRLLSVLIYLISLLPFWVLYRLSDVLFIILYYIVRYRRKVVNSNLSLVFPEKTKKERDLIAYKYFRFLPDIIVEVIKMRTMSPEEVKKRIRLTNPKEVTNYLKQGKAVIGTTAHYGNWEYGMLLLSLTIDNPALGIYKPLSDKKFDDLFNTIRSRFGANMVPMKQTLRKIISLKNEPHMSIFAADQTPAIHDSCTAMSFLGQQTMMYNGVERIAKMTNYPVVFCHIDRIKRGYYTCEITTLVEAPSDYKVEGDITEVYTRFIENIIRSKPELWLWSHRRWKRKITDYETT